MIFQKDINWDDYDAKLKRGRGIIKTKYMKDSIERTKWISSEVPIFTQDTNYILNLI